MKTLSNWQESLEYVNHLGIVHPGKPIGWRQANLMEIVERIETWSVNLGETNYPYPMTVRFHKKLSNSLSLVFTIKGKQVHVKYPR